MNNEFYELQKRGSVHFEAFKLRKVQLGRPVKECKHVEKGILTRGDFNTYWPQRDYQRYSHKSVGTYLNKKKGEEFQEEMTEKVMFPLCKFSPTYSYRKLLSSTTVMQASYI